MMKQVTVSAVESYLQTLAECDTSDAVWTAFSKLFTQSGFDKVSYIVMPLAWETSDNSLIVHADGYALDWLNAYSDRKLWQVDPIAAAALRQSVPFRWSALPSIRSLSTAEQAFLEERSRHVHEDGYAVQVFGPNGRNGYFALGLDAKSQDQDRRDVQVIQWACQLTHHRYCQFGAIRTVPLSRREQEVLSWVARGKSNNSIADILDILSYTVDAYMRRIYQKLGVNDRVSAAIQGLGSGLIQSAA